MGKVNFIREAFNVHGSLVSQSDCSNERLPIQACQDKGRFHLAQPPDTDEAFIVLEGTMFIELENETIELNEGEMYVVLRGTDHKPYAIDECKIMLCLRE